MLRFRPNTLALFALAILSPPAPGFTPSGGENAHPAEFPGYARFALSAGPRVSGEFSGVKIAPHVFLTAAHCVESGGLAPGRQIRVINLGRRTVRVTSVGVAPTTIRGSDPVTRRRHELDLAIFTVEPDIPELRSADLGLLTGKVRPRKGDVYRMVGKRDEHRGVYSYAEVPEVVQDAFCTITENSFEEGSITPGDSGGPLYLRREDQFYLAGITIMHVQEIRSYRDARGEEVYTKARLSQHFTRLDDGAPTRANHWVLGQLERLRTGQELDPGPAKSIRAAPRERRLFPGLTSGRLRDLLQR